MDDSSPERRRVLRIATSVLGLIGGITTAIPRISKNVRAPTNLVIPPHRYMVEEIIQIGVDSST